MHESPAEVAALQRLLDASYERAGPHLLRIHTPDRRATAEQLVERLRGMCLLVLATVTADRRPIAGPVDGVFYRGVPLRLEPRLGDFARRSTAEPCRSTSARLPRRGSGAPSSYAALREAESFLDSGPVYARPRRRECRVAADLA